jgi:hypothetical protein
LVVSGFQLIHPSDKTSRLDQSCQHIYRPASVISPNPPPTLQGL